MQYMPATLLARAKEVRDDGSIVEIVIWSVPGRCLRGAGRRRGAPTTRAACRGCARTGGGRWRLRAWGYLPPCEHRFKYRLHYGMAGQYRVRYDNERGKGDHRHVGDEELAYQFLSIERLLEDFRMDVERWG